MGRWAPFGLDPEQGPLKRCCNVPNEGCWIRLCCDHQVDRKVKRNFYLSNWNDHELLQLQHVWPQFPTELVSQPVDSRDRK